MSMREIDYMWLGSYKDQFKEVKTLLGESKLKSVIHNKWIDMAFFEGERGVFALPIDDEFTREGVRDLSRQVGIEAPDIVPSLEWYVYFLHEASGKRSEDSYSVAYEDIPAVKNGVARELGVPEKELKMVSEWKASKSTN